MKTEKQIEFRFQIIWVLVATSLALRIFGSPSSAQSMAQTLIDIFCLGLCLGGVLDIKKVMRDS